ncbi:RtcB family protein [Listeria costaricensis]|uniref:RtcB family protein n=1 Tax=Listeria costaricensis TaxID=2026604 RepID=UPI000C085C36|nr:RtcB family protein [Listeria costaricensis]
MLTIQGKYNEAKVFTDQLDDSTIGQIMALTNYAFLKDSTIRIMPDTHSGKGCVIGTTISKSDKVVPSLVGVDIGCGIHVTKLSKAKLKTPFDKLDRIIRERIPSGHDTFMKPIATMTTEHFYADIRRDWAARSLGTLGSGNHFIEVAEGKQALYLVIHSGSRILGKDVAEFHQEVAYEKLDLLRKELKEAERSARKKGNMERAAKLGQLREENKLPYEASYLENEPLQAYLHDMSLAQQFAAQNRATMAAIILKAMKWEKNVVETFDCVHNFIDLDTGMVRKGATSAQQGERLIVPLNMRDGSILGVGKGNPEWNYSAPHGAGRLLSRSKAKQAISLEGYQRAMKGIYTTSVSKKTLDEAPAAYKPAKLLMEEIHETMTIEEIIRPVYNFKG